MGRTLRAARIAAAAAAAALAIFSAGCAPTKGRADAGRIDSRPPGAVATEVPPGAFRFDPALFAAKRTAGPGDWLAFHQERPQTFEQYLQASPARPTAERRVIVLQPLGPFSPDEAATLETLREYLGSFFQLETRVAAALPLPSLGKRTRGEGQHAFVQYRTDVLLEQVLAPRLPKDAVCLLGITMADLFPDPSWNFVFGMASLERRVGVYSLARYGPQFLHQPDTAAARRRALERSLLAVAHETGHMFSLPHCVRYECLMNGANSLDELDRGIPWLCPDCLRKLHSNLRFDIRKRYDDLRTFYSERGFSDRVQWIDRRVAQLATAQRRQNPDANANASLTKKSRPAVENSNRPNQISTI